MARGLVSTINLNLNLVYQDDDLITNVAPRLNLVKTVSNQFLNGTGANQNRYLYAAKANASTTPTTIDLIPFTDIFGDSITPSVVRFIAIFNNSSTTGENIIFGGASATAKPWHSGTNSADIIPPGGFIFKYAPSGSVWTLTATFADVIAIASATGTPEFEIYIGMT